MGLRWFYVIGFSGNSVEISAFNIIDYAKWNRKGLLLLEIIVATACTLFLFEYCHLLLELKFHEFRY